MTHDELRQAAINYLARVFATPEASPEPALIQAAVAIVLTADLKKHS